jgi:hypothetical protein
MIGFGLGKNNGPINTNWNVYTILAPNAKDVFYTTLQMWGNIWSIMEGIQIIEFRKDQE